MLSQNNLCLFSFVLRIYAVEIYGWIFLFLTLKFPLFRALEKIALSLKNGYFVYIYQILLTVSAKSANYKIHVSICQPTIKYIWSKLHETIGIYIIEKQKNMTHRYLYRHWGRSKNAHAKINKKIDMKICKLSELVVIINFMHGLKKSIRVLLKTVW